LSIGVFEDVEIVMRNTRPEIQELVREASLIFSGTVVELGASSVSNLAPRDNFAVVRVDNPLRSDPALGDLRRRKITVELLEPGELQPDERVIFFTLNWIHGGGIAAREVTHLETQQEDEVAAEVARLPERHLAERLAGAILVVVAEVTETKPTPFDVRWRNAPQWATASFRIVEALRGQPIENLVVLFPTSGRPMWTPSPRLTKGQRAIFLLHRPPDWPPLPDSGATLTSAVFTVLDPADVQPESQRPLIERLLNQRSIR
jgi:hypothetical protein